MKVQNLYFENKSNILHPTGPFINLLNYIMGHVTTQCSAKQPSEH